MLMVTGLAAQWRVAVMTGATHALDSCTKATARRSAASHSVSPSRLQVARQSYILEVSHIHLCDWHRSLCGRNANDSAACTMRGHIHKAFTEYTMSNRVIAR